MPKRKSEQKGKIERKMRKGTVSGKDSANRRERWEKEQSSRMLSDDGDTVSAREIACRRERACSREQQSRKLNAFGRQPTHSRHRVGRKAMLQVALYNLDVGFCRLVLSIKNSQRVVLVWECLRGPP
jgi:hypothetical protein